MQYSLSLPEKSVLEFLEVVEVSSAITTEAICFDIASLLFSWAIDTMEADNSTKLIYETIYSIKQPDS